MKCPTCKKDTLELCPICGSANPHALFTYDGYETCTYDYWLDRDFIKSDSQLIHIGDYVKTSYGIGQVRKIYPKETYFDSDFEHNAGKRNESQAYVTWKNGDYEGGGWKYWKLNSLIKVEPLSRYSNLEMYL